MDSRIILGDCRDHLPDIPDNSIRLIHTSPPYNIGKEYADYTDNLESDEYLAFIREVLIECYRVLVEGGSFFWQTGYTSNGDGFIIPIDHITVPIFEDVGFKLKDRIIWRYFGGMSFKQKFTNKHETILWWVKPGEKTYFNVFPVREHTKELDPRNNLFGRNPGNVWEVDRVAYGSADQTSHIAVFPEELSDRIVLSASQENEICMDPFSGSGTLCKIAKSRNRRYLGFEISENYYNESLNRIANTQQGEFANILSEIILSFVLNKNELYSINRIIEYIKMYTLGNPYRNLSKYLLPNDILALKEQDTKGIEKKRKKEVWLQLKAYFKTSSNEPLDTIQVIDFAYQKRYKLYSKFNEAMRLHISLGWYDKLLEFLDMEEELISSTIEDIVKSETINYCQEKGVIYKNNGDANSQKRREASLNQSASI